MTLFVIPSAYTVLDDLTLWVAGRARGTRRAESGSAPLPEQAGVLHATGQVEPH